MALFKVFKGLSGRLTPDLVPYRDGHTYFCTDDTKWWIDFETAEVGADGNPVLERKYINQALWEELKSHLPQMEEDDILATQKWVTENVSGGETDLSNYSGDSINLKSSGAVQSEIDMPLAGGINLVSGNADLNIKVPNDGALNIEPINNEDNEEHMPTYIRIDPENREIRSALGLTIINEDTGNSLVFHDEGVSFEGQNTVNFYPLLVAHEGIEIKNASTDELETVATQNWVLENVLTLDSEKLSFIDVVSGGFRGTGIHESQGINWRAQIDVLDKDDGILASYPTWLSIPIAAGNGISFEVDEQEQFVKINATSGGDTIIDVETLPTSDINDKAVYRLFEGEAFSTFGGVKNTIGTAPVTFYTVDTLPTAGEYVTDNEKRYIKAYYQKSDNLAYGYVPGALIGGSDMWIELSQIVGMMLDASLWGGYLTYAEYMESAFDAAKIFIVYHTKATHYTYKNEWYKIGGSEDVVKVDDETIVLSSDSTVEDFNKAYQAYVEKNKNIVYYFRGREYLSIISMDNSDDGIYDCKALGYSIGDFEHAPETGDPTFYTVLIHHSSGNTTVSYPDVLATREWVRENVSGGDIDDSNYAKLDSTNTFTSTDDVNRTSEVSATAIKLNYLSSGVIPFALTIDANKIIKQDSGMIAEYTFDTSAGGVLATQEWVIANSGSGSSENCVDTTTFGQEITVKNFSGTTSMASDSGCTSVGSTVLVTASSGPNSAELLNDQLTFVTDTGYTSYEKNKIGRSSMGKQSDLTLPEETGTLATREWVTTNAGGGGTVDDSNYAKLDSANTFTGTNTVTISPSDSNPFYFVGGMGGSDTAYGMKFESAMRYSDTTTYGMGGITIDRFQDYGGQIKHTTKITFPESSDSLPVTPTTTTLTLPNSSGELATKEYIDAQIDALRTELKAYIDQVILGGEW